MQNISSSTFSIPQQQQQQQQQQQPTILFAKLKKFTRTYNKLKVDQAKKLPRIAKTKQAEWLQ